LSAQPSPSGQVGFVHVQNFGTTHRDTTLDWRVDGKLLSARSLSLDGGSGTDVSFPLPSGAQRLSATLQPGDAFALDDTAWALARPAAGERVLLVSPDGNVFLQQALRVLPGLQLTTVTSTAFDAGAAAQPADLYIFDRFLPPALPNAPVLIVDPPTSTVVPTGQAFSPGTLQPAGPDPQTSTAIGFFELAAKQNPKPQTVALVGADAEYPQNALVGARELIKKFGFKTVYDKTYPPSTVDYTPIVRSIKATNADIVFVASYPPDSVGMLRAAQEVGLQPKIFGGGMVGLQFTSVMTSMGPMLNGIVNYDFWAPEATMLAFPGIKEFLKEYQARAEKAGVDPLGYYLPPYSYSLVQILGQAVEATQSLDQQKLADHIRATEFNTLVGKVKFGKNGEWAKGRTLMVQYQKVHGTGIDQFRGPGKKVVLYPEEFKSGAIIYPYAAAKN